MYVKGWTNDKFFSKSFLDGTRNTYWMGFIPEKSDLGRKTLKEEVIELMTGLLSSATT